MSAQPIPVFDPQGTLRDIPSDQLPAAVKAGGMPAVRFMAPDKSIRYVPANQTQDAYKAGGTILPLEDQDVQHPGFWATLVDDVQGAAKGMYHSLADYDPLSDPNLSDSAKNQIVARQQSDAAAKVAARTKQYGPVYANVSAPANEMLGVNVEGMEKSAAQGDQGGVVGHAAAVPAMSLAAELGTRALASRIARAVSVSPEAIAKPEPVKTSAPLDATGENEDYAGEKPSKPQPWNAHDATGENRDFAGERTPPPTASLKVQDLTKPQPTAPTSEAAPVAASQPSPPATQAKPAAKPATQATPEPTRATDPFFNTPDPLLNRLRSIAADIEAQDARNTTKAKPETVSGEPNLEDDLTPILLQSLRQVQEQKAAH
jgi:hypothetical protein